MIFSSENSTKKRKIVVFRPLYFQFFSGLRPSKNSRCGEVVWSVARADSGIDVLKFDVFRIFKIARRNTSNWIFFRIPLVAKKSILLFKICQKIVFSFFEGNFRDLLSGISRNANFWWSWLKILGHNLDVFRKFSYYIDVLFWRVFNFFDVEFCSTCYGWFLTFSGRYPPSGKK